MIELDKVTRTYGTGSSAVAALRGVSTTIEAGTMVTIVGASGSGKSTLLNIIGTLDRPTEGRVLLDGVQLGELDDNSRTRLRREKIGFVFQFFNLLPTLNALENVMLPAKLAGQSGKAAHDRAADLLQRVGLANRAAHRPDELSGGEMQRVAIARSLMMDPPVLLADEPTGNLDSETGKKVMTLLRGAVADNRTVVLVTHDPKIAAQGDRRISMADGAIEADDTL